MTLPGMDHVRKLQECTIFILVGMVAWLRWVSCTTCNEDPSIFCLNWTESNGYIKVYIEQFSCLFVGLNIVKGQDSLIKFEEVDSVCRAFITESLELVGIAQLIKSTHPHPSKERVLCIWASKSHALSKHFLTATVGSEDTVGVLSELRMNYGWILTTPILFLLRLE